MLEFLRDLIDRKDFAAAWEYCKSRKNPCGRQKWFAALQEVCKKKAEQQHGAEREQWEKRRTDCERLKKENRKKCRLRKARQEPRWPSSLAFVEFLYHFPGPHLHIASRDRAGLIAVCKIGQESYGLRIGEYPPFDSVECVHVSGSWHYRFSNGTLLPCNSPRLDKGGDGGSAADINDLDGGNDQEVAFMNELEDRYR
jgi:hypothetical protein